MGKKGEKMTQESILSAQELVEKLITIEEVTSKRMFGGHGIFHQNKMFGLITAKGGQYLKANSSNVDHYLSKGSEKHAKLSYYSIPSDILNNHNLLIEWALLAIEASKYSQK